jgi:cobalamin biosynthesis Mg chelatase CobN
MHLLRTTPGGFVDDAAGVMRIEQTPAPIVVLSSADPTLSLLASAVPRLEAGFPAVRLANQAFLRQPASVDFYVDDVLRHARVVIVDHLGGEAYWPYGIERIVALAKREKQTLVMFSGDLQEDPNLVAHSAGAAKRVRRARCRPSRSIIRSAKSRPSTTGARAGPKARPWWRYCSIARICNRAIRPCSTRSSMRSKPRA